MKPNSTIVTHLTDTPKETYRKYLNSPEWKAAKTRYRNSGLPQYCLSCGCTDEIDFHHKTYKRLGCEKLTDIIPLCRTCHDLLHKQHKESGTPLWSFTDSFLARGKVSRAAEGRQSIKSIGKLARKAELRVQIKARHREKRKAKRLAKKAEKQGVNLVMENNRLRALLEAAELRAGRVKALELENERLRKLLDDCNHGKGSTDRTDWRHRMSSEDNDELTAEWKAVVG